MQQAARMVAGGDGVVGFLRPFVTFAMVRKGEAAFARDLIGALAAAAAAAAKPDSAVPLLKLPGESLLHFGRGDGEEVRLWLSSVECLVDAYAVLLRKLAHAEMVVYSNVYMLDDGMRWKELPPMPKPDSHIEFAWVNANNSLIIAGGTTKKHPITKKMVLVGEVFRFNLDTLEWTVIGRLPFRIKTTLVGYWDGWLYFTSGQRDKGPTDPSPKKVVGCMWRTKLHL